MTHPPHAPPPPPHAGGPPPPGPAMPAPPAPPPPAPGAGAARPAVGEVHGAVGPRRAGQRTLHPAREDLVALVSALRDDGYLMCLTVTAVDYLAHRRDDL